MVAAKMSRASSLYSSTLQIDAKKKFFELLSHRTRGGGSHHTRQ